MGSGTAFLCAVAGAMTVGLAPGSANAAPEASAEASVSTDGASASGDTSERLSKRKDRPWIQRWAPERNMVELGIYGGVLFPARDLELFEPDFTLPDQGFRPLKVVAPEIGGRLGYYPIPYVGIEAEGGWAPTSTDIGDLPVNLWTVRGHVVGQLGWWSVTPFILVGGGVLTAQSERAAVGNDIDGALHFGFGAKFFINRYLSARAEMRNIVTPSRGVGAGATNNIELLAGLSITLGRQRDREGDKPRDDFDGDGFLDDADACPTRAGVAPDGCPLEDRDSDGFLDIDDKCPDVHGVAPDGCPPPDTDGDGVLDPDDACPKQAADTPTGCPDEDPDKDGVLALDDKCPHDPETRNGFEDSDGCPDEVPADLAKFSGTIEGVFFQLNHAVLEPNSMQILDDAVETLKRYESVHVEISGHTDSSGPREFNMTLSKDRADAVKAYLVEKGIDDARVTTRGAGPDEPIDTNKTADGRSRNRRIEFRVR